jgi:hypothetical protein
MTYETTEITHDLYKDIHKALRAELFGLTVAAGSTDPSDDATRHGLAERVAGAVRLLVDHAEHEDEHVQGSIERVLPRLAHRIADDHVALDARMLELGSLANAAADARSGETARRRLHVVYLELASFTSAYLAHQDIEERVVMPALCQAMPVNDLLAIHHAIVSSIPPAAMADGLALMLPAMNVEDRVELLGGMQQGAPPEVFAGVVGLAQSVLPAADHAALASRLGLVGTGG